MARPRAKARSGGQLDLGIPETAVEVGWGEAWARARGRTRILGVDEVGRGPLAGPVVAAAVVLPGGLEAALVADGLTDSKKLSASRREAFAARILAGAAVGVAEVDAARIDEVNILEATFEAMRAAIAQVLAQVELRPDCILIDGNQPLLPSPVPEALQKTLIQGDARAVCIAAASVVAKVHRDALMAGYDAVHPGYGFAGHKGYPCAEHLEALGRLGPSPIHRRSFRGVVSEEGA